MTATGRTRQADRVHRPDLQLHRGAALVLVGGLAVQRARSRGAAALSRSAFRRWARRRVGSAGGGQSSQSGAHRRTPSSAAKAAHFLGCRRPGTRSPARSAPLVRRRRRGQDPRASRHAHRRHAARQEQAGVHAARGHGRLRDRRQRREDPRHRQEARREDLLPPLRLSRAASERARCASSSSGGPTEVLRKAVKGMLPRNRLGAPRSRSSRSTPAPSTRTRRRRPSRWRSKLMADHRAVPRHRQAEDVGRARHPQARRRHVVDQRPHARGLLPAHDPPGSRLRR